MGRRTYEAPRRLVYIAAPFAALPAEVQALREQAKIRGMEPPGHFLRKVLEGNVLRARQLASWAHDLGFAPIVIHGEIAAGTYGLDSDPRARAKGIHTATSIARGVAVAGGMLWTILRDDMTRSAGSTREQAAFVSAFMSTFFCGPRERSAGRVPLKLDDALFADCTMLAQPFGLWASSVEDYIARQNRKSLEATS